MTEKPKPKVEQRKITEFQPDPHNANAGSERGLRILDDSVSEVGLGRSIVTDKNGVIIGGNKTQERAVDHGFEDAIVVHSTGEQLVIVQRDDLDLSDPDPNNKARKLAYFDNRAGELGLVWDAQQIAADIEAGMDLSYAFSEDELAAIVGGVLEPTPDAGAQIDKAAELQKQWQVRRGDLWTIGNHRLLCGDSTNADDVARLCVDKVQGVFTSPPYAEQRKDQYGGIPSDEYVAWWEAIQANVRSVLKPDGSFFVNIKPHAEDKQRNLYVLDLVIAMVRQWGWLFVDEYCWLRNGIPQQVINRFKNSFEPVYWFANTEAFYFNPQNVMHYSDNVPIPMGKGAGDTNAAKRQGTGKAAIYGNTEAPGMAYPSNVLNFTARDKTTGHPAAFPVALPDFFIHAYSDEGDIWLDPFMGSGTVFVAAEQNNRVAYGMERLEKYCAVILQRMADMGLTPVREGNPTS